MMSLRVKGTISVLENLKLRDLKKDLDTLKNDLTTYKYTNKVDEYTDRTIYNITCMMQVDIFDMSMAEIKEFLIKLQHVLEFANL